MTCPKVRAHYDQLSSIAHTFVQQADLTQKTFQQLSQHIDALQGGDWRGRGADAFYREMRDAVLPGMVRLTAALKAAAQTTAHINQVMRQAEEQAARLLWFNSTSNAPGVGSGGAGSAMEAASDGGMPWSAVDPILAQGGLPANGGADASAVVAGLTTNRPGPAGGIPGEVEQGPPAGYFDDSDWVYEGDYSLDPPPPPSPASTTERLEDTIDMLRNIGLDTSVLESLIDSQSPPTIIETEDTAENIEMFNGLLFHRLYLQPEHLDVGELLAREHIPADAASAVATLFHEASHSYFIQWSGDPVVDGLLSSAEEYYRDAPLKDGSVSDDPGRVAHEAIATYVGNRNADYVLALSWLQFGTQADATPEQSALALRRAEEMYARSLAPNTAFGYETHGSEQISTTRPMPQWLKDEIEGVLFTMPKTIHEVDEFKPLISALNAKGAGHP
jgi:WXG100 family type VII secretion target